MVVEENQPVYYLFRNPGVAVCEALNFQEQHDLHYLGGYRIAGACSVAHHQVHLESLNIAVGNPDIAQRAKTGIDTVNELIRAIDSVIQIGAAGFDAFAAFVTDGNTLSGRDNPADKRDGQMAGTDFVVRNHSVVEKFEARR
jgi:hypothetical protein